MGSIVTSKFRIHNAEQFVEAFSETSNSIIYLTIGKNTAFPDDNSPPTPVNSTANVEYTPWRDMYAAKRVTASDVTHAVPRYDWTTGTVYDQYDDQDTNLLDDDFYVMTDEYHVFKCLFNNGGANSTSKPTKPATIDERFTTADGYVWRYLYTVSTANALKFLTSDYIPVQTLASDDGSDQWDVQQGAVDGAIENILVTNAGSGYFSGNTTVTITGDGTGATATVTTSAEPGTITGITVTNVGSGYTTATVSISGDGASATGRAIISPKGGHGSNPIEELGGKYVMMNVRLDGNEANTHSTANEFRQVSLVRDPYEYGTTNRATSSVYRQTFRYDLTSTSGDFVLDEVATSGSNTAFVVEWDGTNDYLFTTLPLNQEFANSATVTGAGGASGTISVINDPGLQPYSGELLYVENRVPIARATDQIEDVKLIVQF
jgi:hypothetical protein